MYKVGKDLSEWWNEWVTFFCDQHDGGGERDGKYQYSKKKNGVCLNIWKSRESRELGSESRRDGSANV